MNRINFKFSHRVVFGLFLLLPIFTFAFGWTRSAASGRTESKIQNNETIADIQQVKTDNEAERVTLKAAKRGFPLINLQDGKELKTTFFDADGARQPVNVAQTRPVSIINADLNADGAADLLVGYAGNNGGGRLAYYHGSLDTLSARTPEIFEGMKNGRFPAPFLPGASLIELPVAPDFTGTGDFNRDGWKDIVIAQRGDDQLLLLFGNEKKSFTSAYVKLNGQITAMLTGNIDPLDNAADIAVAVIGENGASLQVYDGAADAFEKSPETYSLPAEAASLALGQLDDDAPMDILAACANKAVIVHGSYPQDKTPEAERVESLDQNFDIAAVRVGNFVWDRDYRPEIALLSTGGAVEILQRGSLDTRDYSPAEWKTRWKIRRDEAMARDAAHGKDIPLKAENRAGRQWTTADRMQVAAPLDVNRTSAAAFFSSTRMSTFGVDDLLVLDSASRKLHVLVWNNDDLKNTGESYALSDSGGRADIALDVEGTPVAALPMRLSVMTRPGIVFLNEESSNISYVIAAPAATYTVTKTADTYDNACNADCSFREALQAANAAGGTADMIMLPTGTYTINTALGPPDAETTVDPAAQQSGDWDAFFDTTIVGGGQATTILQGGATVATGHDRVMDAIQQQVGVPDLSLSGVTLQNGRCRADAVCSDGGGLHYAVDALGVLTISDSTVTNNRTEVNTANPANNGGGIAAFIADYSFTNLTVTNNTTAFVTGGCTNCAGEGGGLLVSGGNTANPTSLMMTNSTVTGNNAQSATTFGGRGGAVYTSSDSTTISGGTYSTNIAAFDGGAF